MGVSVVQFDTSYGGSSGLWEVAVLDTEGNLDYTTEITDDVLGWLSEENVTEVMNKVESL